MQVTVVGHSVPPTQQVTSIKIHCLLHPATDVLYKNTPMRLVFLTTEQVVKGANPREDNQLKSTSIHTNRMAQQHTTNIFPSTLSSTQEQT